MRARVLPTEIRVTVYVDGVLASGMFVKVHIVCRSKNSYDLVFGPSKDDGTISISRESLISAARRELEMFPMDYRNVEADCTGEVVVEPLNALDLQRALRAARLFGSDAYPRNYVADLTQALTILSGDPPKISIAVRAKRGSVRAK